MAVGIGFVALITAAAAERFVATGLDEERGLRDAPEARLVRRLDEIAERLDRIEAALRDRGPADAPSPPPSGRHPPAG